MTEEKVAYKEEKGLKKKLHIRNGYRGHVSRPITEFFRTNEQDLLNLKRLEKSLKEKLKIFKNIDDEILELIPEDETETLTNKIDKSCQFSDEINGILVKIEGIFSKSNVENSSVHSTVQRVLLCRPTQMIHTENFQNLLSTNLMERYHHGKVFGISIL